MNALVYHGPREMRWEAWDERPPEPGEAVVSVRAVGICGSDLHGYTGESGRRTPPMVMGHEATGDVIALGSDAPKDWAGRRVVIQPFLACGTCDQCLSGAINLCRNRRFLGGNTNGAMAERITIPASNLLPLPEALSYVNGSLAEPLAVAIHAIRQAGALIGKSVLIVGCGPIGLLTLIAARRAGAGCVVMTDVIPKRLAIARALGAAAALDPTADNWRAALGEVIHSERAEVDVAFDAVGVQPTFQQAIDALRPGGTLIAIGGWRSVNLNLSQLVAREISLRGTFNFTPAEFADSLNLLAEGYFDPSTLVSSTHAMADGASVFADLSQSQADAIKVVLTSG